MRKQMKTPITLKAWRELKSGDGIKDKHGRLWIVRSRDRLGNSNRLFAKCPGYSEDRLDWVDGQILDEEQAIVIELNHSSVVIWSLSQSD